MGEAAHAVCLDLVPLSLGVGDLPRHAIWLRGGSTAWGPSATDPSTQRIPTGTFPQASGGPWPGAHLHITGVRLA